MRDNRGIERSLYFIPGIFEESDLNMYIMDAVELDMVKSVLADPLQFNEVRDVYPEQLNNPVAKALWAVVRSKNGKVSASSLYHELGTFEEGQKVHAIYTDIDSFRSLYSEGATVGSAAQLADHVRADYTRRQIDGIVEHRNPHITPSEQALQMARELTRIAYFHDPEDGVDQLVKAGNDVIHDVLWKIANPGKGLGWKVGEIQYDDFLQSIGGLMGEKLIVTGALTSRGKTQWLLNQALGYALNKRDDTGEYAKVAYVSTEMGYSSIAKRVISHFANLNLFSPSQDPEFEKKLLAGQEKWNELVESKRFVVVHDVMNIDTIYRRFGAMRSRGELDIGIIDYIGMIQGGRGYDKASSYSAVGEVVKVMQQMTREFQMPIITAAQLNRGTYENPGGKPEMSNMADSSIINHCANAIHLLWRPDEDSKHIAGENAAQWKNIVQMITAKVRDGAGYKPMFYHFNGSTATFTTCAPDLRRTLGSEKEQMKLIGKK